MNVKVSTPWMAEKASQYPDVLNAEIAFFGRSNVGKSSLLNALLNRKNLAYTSSTPGKTKTVNFYWMDHDFYIADLPGYGYAHKQKNSDRFARLFEEYLASNRITHAFLLIDGRQDINPLDQQMAETFHYLEIPFSVVLTKQDKLNQSGKHQAKERAKNAFKIHADHIYLVSALNKKGIDPLKDAINAMMGLVN